MSLDYLPLIFFFIALFYSSVGFGGGSSYLAILSLFFTNFYEIRSTALILNICVVSISTGMFIRNRVFDFKLFWPFLVSSIPLAYLGAQLRLSQKTFFLILGLSLIVSGVVMISRFFHTRLVTRKFSLSKKMGIGGSVGLLAGISGIGGGIFLSPLLHLFQWANAKTIASLASVFILSNSLSGLIGLSVAGTFELNQDLIVKLILAVGLGGIIGSYLSNKKFSFKLLGLLTALLVCYVGSRLVLLHAFDIRI